MRRKFRFLAGNILFLGIKLFFCRFSITDFYHNEKPTPIKNIYS
jgi:hypothetical protein